MSTSFGWEGKGRYGSFRQCAGKTVRSLENVCHTWAPYRCVDSEALYNSTFYVYGWINQWIYLGANANTEQPEMKTYACCTMAGKSAPAALKGSRREEIWNTRETEQWVQWIIVSVAAYCFLFFLFVFFFFGGEGGKVSVFLKTFLTP